MIYTERSISEGKRKAPHQSPYHPSTPSNAETMRSARFPAGALAAAVVLVLLVPVAPAEHAEGAPANDHRDHAEVIDTVFDGDLFIDFTRITLNTTGATVDPDEPPKDVAWIDIGATVWYKLKAGAGPVQITTEGSDFDSVLCVYGADGNGLLFPQPHVRCSDDDIGRQSSVLFDVNPGDIYYVQVGGYAGATGELVLNVHGVATHNYLPVTPPS